MTYAECYLQHYYSETECHINIRSTEKLSLKVLRRIRVHFMIIKSQWTVKKYHNFSRVTGGLNDITFYD